jgi:mannosylglucosylglycerate synthase
VANIAIVSFRLGGTDGVSIESAKWADAFRSLGHSVRLVAGSGPVDVQVEGLSMSPQTVVSPEKLKTALEGCEVVVVENVASLPLNPKARDVLYEVLHNRTAIFHHHDFSWQREHLAHFDGPRDEPQWLHVTINKLSEEQLRERGIEAVTIMNSFDCNPPQGDRLATRNALQCGDEIIVLLPTRAIPRKNVQGAITLAQELSATLWLLGPPEDGYDEELDLLLSSATCPLKRGLPNGFSIDDAYAACDLVVMPSHWEGFGNPVLESVTHRRPLALNFYPVAKEIASFGFRFYELSDIAAIRTMLEGDQTDLFDHNLDIATKHFNLANLPLHLQTLLARTGRNNQE